MLSSTAATPEVYMTLNHRRFTEAGAIKPADQPAALCRERHYRKIQPQTAAQGLTEARSRDGKA